MILAGFPVVINLIKVVENLQAMPIALISHAWSNDEFIGEDYFGANLSREISVFRIK